MSGLAPALAAAAVAVYFFQDHLDEPRRVLVALAAAGFFLAPVSEKPLRVALWLAGVAATAWGAQLAGAGKGGLPLWLACSVAGAVLVVRGGSRAALHTLPPADGEMGARLRRAIRRELQISVMLFLAAYLAAPRSPVAGAAAAGFSAVFFLRYLLLQSKHLGVAARPMGRESGIVPAQRWFVLFLFALVGATRFPQALLAERGQEPLLLTAVLLMVLAALLFVFAIVRAGWPRGAVRRASFAAGLLLAVALTAILVELESWDRTRYRVFASACIFFLVVLPFMKDRTRLFEEHPRVSLLVAPVSLAMMLAPVTAVSGTKWFLPATVFLFAFAVLLMIYAAVVARRERSRGILYPAMSLLVMLHPFFTGGGGRTWQIFLVAVGFVLYSIDLFERVWRKSGGA